MFLLLAGIPCPVRLLMQVSVASSQFQHGEQAPEPGKVVPMKRLRKKTTLNPVSQKKTRSSENLKGNPMGKGKNPWQPLLRKKR